MTEFLPIPLDTIFLGDCRDLLHSLPDQCADLVVSSPPFSYSTVERRGKGADNRLYNQRRQNETRKALVTYLDQQTEILKDCCRILKETGSLFWQLGSFSDIGGTVPLDVRFFPILEALGLIPRNRIILAKQSGARGQRNFSCRHATILWFTKSDDYVFHGDEGQDVGDLWVFQSVGQNHEEQTIFPCQFPEDLTARMILSATNEGGVVVDPYIGSGTVAVVAKEFKRHFIGAEIDARYHAVALKRLSGEPDADGYFPNLKTLRRYVERTGEPSERFCADIYAGRRPRRQFAQSI